MYIYNRKYSSDYKTSHRKVQESLSRKFHEVRLVDSSTMTVAIHLPPQPQKLVKDASSMTNIVHFVNSAVQACKQCTDIACQCDPDTSDRKTVELVSSKSSYYYSLGNFSDLRGKRSYSDSEYTLVPETSCEVVGKGIPSSESDTTVMLTPVASFSDARTVGEASKTRATIVKETMDDQNIPGSKSTDRHSGHSTSEEWMTIPRSKTTTIITEVPSGHNCQKTPGPNISGSNVGLESASSSEENVRKHSGAVGKSAHKCVWQQQVKTLQQRMRSLRRQVRRNNLNYCCDC